MEKKEFKAESKKILDLMINSIYTHKEIFLRELISNSSDALDKLYYKSLEEGYTGIQRKDFYIEIVPDLETRTLTIKDNGIGMTKEELETNLGTIAKSGSGSFKRNFDRLATENDDIPDEAVDIIGQFGVGFYSSFMVADRVTVLSKAYGSDQAYLWESEGADGFTVTPAGKEENGTIITLEMKADCEDTEYSLFLEEYTIIGLVKKYSDYIRYPIKMLVTKTREVMDDDEEENEDLKQIDDEKMPRQETYQEMMNLNSMEPIWKRPKNQVTDEEYNNFYKNKYADPEDPARVIRTSVEGLSSYTALIFVPSHVPYDYRTKDYKKGLELYSAGVMIMPKCEDLVPDFFNFVSGVVDSQDLSLNISREMLQHDRQLKIIEKNVTKKIKNDLIAFRKEDREGYEKFFDNFGKQLKYGLYTDFGRYKETLQDLVMFYSSMEKKLITFGEYLDKMKDDQEFIYFASGDSYDNIDMLPQVEYIKSKGYEILYLVDSFDEFVLQMTRDYEGKKFKSVLSEDIEVAETDEEKEAMKKVEEDNQGLIDKAKEVLGDKVEEVKLSPRLQSAAVCLSSKGGLSIEMEKVLNMMPSAENQQIKASRVLEINPEHPVMKVLQDAYGKGEDGAAEFSTYVNLLYRQAVLIAGLQIDNPVEFSKDICSIMTGEF